jgi:hypothetical protein
MCSTMKSIEDNKKKSRIFESFGIIGRGSSFKDFVPSCQRELCNFNQLGAFGSDS